MIGAILVGILFGLGIPAVIFFIAASGMDSKNGFVRMLVVIPMGAFISGFLGIVVAALTETKDTMGNAVGDAWQVWFWITSIGTSLFAIGAYFEGRSKDDQVRSINPPFDVDTDLDDDEIERVKWEITKGIR